MQEGQCRRKAVLSYFGEKHPKCQSQTEVMCDFCQTPRKISKAVEDLQAVLHTKAMPPTKTSAPEDLANAASDRCRDEQQYSSVSSLPTADTSFKAPCKQGVPAATCARAGRKPPALPIPRDGDCQGSQIGAQGSNTDTPFVSISSQHSLKKKRFSVPFKTPRPAQ